MEQRPALAPGARIGHFTIVARLAAPSGQGEVYRAHDANLPRDVAIKVLPQATADDPNARARLLQEAQRAASLHHDRICTIYEVGQEQGIDFIAMEWVEGRPLNEAGGVAGFAPSAITRIGMEIAEALEHAHDHRVVHRDLKSANVMLTPDGRVKVIDFGLARLVPSVDSDTVDTKRPRLTEKGAIVGTTHYMAPEVLLGAEADARSDIWALGVVLHEMAAGELPFAGQTHYEVAGAIMHSDPRPLPERAPPGLRAIIAHCLQKEPARRYQHAGEVRAALEAVASGNSAVAPPAPPSARMPRTRPRPSAAQVAGIVTGALVLAAAFWFLRVRVPPAPVHSDSRRSLAILPLDNLSRDPAQAYFADGMTDEISTRLAQIAALRVISQSSVLELVRKQKSMIDIGRALGVPILLRGSVLRAGDNVRITVQLVEASTGNLIWADSYERSMLDILTLQSQLALAIAHEIQVKLTPEEQTRVSATRQIDPEAYQAYLRGRAAWNKGSLKDFEEAERLFRHTLEIVPDYAPAWSGLADVAYGVSNQYSAPNVAIPKARAAAEKALAMDSSLAEAHTSIGMIKMVYDWDWVGAEREFDRAIALKPGYADAHLWRGKLLVAQGRFDAGLESIGRAIDLDPLSPRLSQVLAWHLYLSRRYDQALEHVQTAIAMDPDYKFFLFIVGQIHEQQGDHGGAIAALEKQVAADTNSDGLAQLAHAYGTAGRRADAMRTISRLIELRKHSFAPAADVAFAYAGLGDRDEAFRWLDAAVEDHSEILTILKVEPGFDPLRSDPRFDKVLRRVNLAP